MTTYRRARQRVSRRPLTEAGIAATLRRTLPRRCNFEAANYGELLAEALDFGVTTHGAFRQLMLRHRRTAIWIDQEPLDELNQRLYRNLLGDADYVERIRLQRWFTWAGLTRLVFELEFGEAYNEYMRLKYPSETEPSTPEDLAPPTTT